MKKLLEKYNYEITTIICIIMFPVLAVRYFFHILSEKIKKIMRKNDAR